MPASIPQPPDDERLLLGFETSDDAAVWLVSDDLAAVLTVDFFTPIVDEPFDFGRVAAANALSDVFAMGATPHVALNLLALDCQLGTDVAAEILRGGADAVRRAGAYTCGGHTIDDPEPKYGLTVFGTVRPERIVRNAGAQVGDMLYLTKPIGTGIMSAAYKIERIGTDEMQPVIESMAELNAAGRDAMLAASVHAATDVTGFGLVGHLNEMLCASGAAAEISFESLPLFEGVWDLSCAWCRPGRTFSIIDDVGGCVAQGELSDEDFDNRMGVLCDPQTSGGLLVAIPPEGAETFERKFECLANRKAARIGRIVEGEAGSISLT